jgi:hypothetical protein
VGQNNFGDKIPMFSYFTGVPWDFRIWHKLATFFFFFGIICLPLALTKLWPCNTIWLIFNR